jgi:Divergent InlB B-repeat domain
MKMTNKKTNLTAICLATIFAATLCGADEAKLTAIQTALSNTTISGSVSTSVNWNPNPVVPSFTVQYDNSDAPLLLTSTVGGKICASRNGKIIPAGTPVKVGTTYQLQAMPDAGYVFQNWTPIVVSAVVLNSQIDEVVTNTISTPASFARNASWSAKTQPTQVLVDAADSLMVIKTLGWQANFTPKLPRQR